MLEQYFDKVYYINDYVLNKLFNKYPYPKWQAYYEVLSDAKKNKYNRVAIFTDNAIIYEDNIIKESLDNSDLSGICVLCKDDPNENCISIDRATLEKLPRLNLNFFNFRDSLISFLETNRHYSNKPICRHKVDYVVTFVDDSDPVWQAERNKYQENTAQSRYRDWGLLEYNIKCVEKYCSFIDDIYLIVSGQTQVPSWVKDHPKIKPIYHNQLIPEKYLPVFNSCAIEMFIWNIKEMSEYYIYANDDTFVIDDLYVNDMFENGKCKYSFLNISKTLNTHQKICVNGFKLILNEVDNNTINSSVLDKNVKRLNHIFHPYLKSTGKHFWEYSGHAIDKSITKFRNPDNMNQYLYGMYEYLIGNYELISVANQYFDINSDNVLDDIENQYDVLICVNDKASIEYNEDLKNQLHHAFDKNLKSCKKEKSKIVKPLIKNPLKIALCAIAKNENLYIKEWVEYYKNIGIDRIFLYDNNEINGERFEDVIQDYIDSGFVKVINKRGIIKTTTTDKDGKTLQGLCYKECYDKYFREYDWFMFFDIDEYLELITNKYNNIFDLLTDRKYNNCDGLRVQWRMYGDNGEDYFSHGLINDRFKNNRNYYDDKTIKTLLKGKKHHKNDILFCAHGPLLYLNNINVINLDNSTDHNSWRHSVLKRHEPMVLNHFYCKSMQEFISRKFNQSSAITGINYKRNYNVDFLKKQYFQYNICNTKRINLFNEFIDNKISKKSDIIVSFTTWPAREIFVKDMLLSLSKQTVKPDKIICWLSNEEYNGIIPDSLKECLKNNLLTEVQFVNKNTYGHKRYNIFKKYFNSYVILVDDDLYYPSTYIETMLTNAKKYPGCVSCYYSRIDKYNNKNRKAYPKINQPSIYNRYFSGLSIFPPNTFPLKSFEYIDIRDNYLQKCDDSWIYGWLLYNKTPINGIYNYNKDFHKMELNNSQNMSLFNTVNNKEISNVKQYNINMANILYLLNLNNEFETIFEKCDINEIQTCNKKIFD